MINLFHIPQYNIDTSKLGHLLHGPIIREFEEEFADYAGSKYAVSTSSCAMGIFLSFMGPWNDSDTMDKNDVMIRYAMLNRKRQNIKIPSILPYVVPSVLLHAGQKIEFTDNVKWVGHSYVLHEFDNFKIIDSAQDVYYKQFEKEANPQDIILYSFYPTKPVGGADGGMICSNDEEKIEWFKKATMYGSIHKEDSWDRVLEFPGWKSYINSIQAYIALQNLRKLNEKRQRLNEISSFYNDKLGYHNNSCHLYRILVNNNDEYLKRMKERGISCGHHYKACHLMPVYKNYIKEKSLSRSEYIDEHTISLPFHEKLTNEDLNQVVEAVHELKYLKETEVTTTCR